MNRREGVPPAGSPVSAEIVSVEIGDLTGSGDFPPPDICRRPEAAATEQHIEHQHLDKVAQALCRLLGAQAQPRLLHRLQSWPQVYEEAEDMCQLAALAFMEAYRQGRITPDAAAGVHTARSVAAYAWGICNRIFANVVRSSRPLPLSLDETEGELAAPRDTGLLDELLGAGPGDSESRLWEVLSVASGRCRPEDIIVTYLIANGVTVGEVRNLLDLSPNTPANAVKRVGRELRDVLGLKEPGGAKP